MKRQPLAWWVIPSIITGSLAALGAVGTVIIQSANWLQLPAKVEAGEMTNQRQDEAINKLTAIQEYWKDVYATQQQQQVRPPPAPAVQPQAPLREWDDQDRTFWCCATTSEDCWERSTWYQCD